MTSSTTPPTIADVRQLLSNNPAVKDADITAAIEVAQRLIGATGYRVINNAALIAPAIAAGRSR